MTPSPFRQRIQDLYEMSCYQNAEGFMWLLRVIDEVEPSQWSTEVAARGGPVKSRIDALIRKYRILDAVDR